MAVRTAAWCRSRARAEGWRPSFSRLPAASSPPEAGFSLVEVLAALAIASLALVMAMQVMVQSARVTARLTHETAARDLLRRLLAEEARGSGTAGVLTWTATLEPLAAHLARRSLTVAWTGGQVTAARLETLP